MGKVLTGQGSTQDGCARFEAALCAYMGVRHVRAVDSGRVALHLALAGLGLQPGAKVILPRYCFYSLVHVLQGMDFVPQWAPVDPDTLSLDPTRLDIQDADAVVLIHPFGQLGAVDQIRELCDQAGAALIEDGSQATGGMLGQRRVGALGKAGVFSLVSGKNLQTFGGGILSTDDDELIARVDQILSHASALPDARVKKAMRSGVVRWFLTTPIGYGGLMHPLTRGMQALAPDRLEAMFHEERLPYDPQRVLHRLSDAQGHLGCIELQELDRRNRIRREHAHQLMDGLQGVVGLKLPAFDQGAINTWNALAVRVHDGPKLQQALRSRGIDTRSDYMSWYGDGQDFTEDVIYLPNHPGMTSQDVQQVIRAVRDVL